MAGKMSIGALQTIAFFDEARVKVDRLYSLIEQYAGAKTNLEQYLGPITRTAVDVNRLLMNKGYGVMADTANQIAIAHFIYCGANAMHHRPVRPLGG
jgi:hypothetical protein